MSDLPTASEAAEAVKTVGGAAGMLALAKVIASSAAKWGEHRAAEKRARAEAALAEERSDLETVAGLRQAYLDLRRDFDALRDELAKERALRLAAEKRAADAETGKFHALADAEGRMLAMEAEHRRWRAEFNRDFNRLRSLADAREQEARRFEAETRSGNMASSGRHLPGSRFDDLDTLPPPRGDD